MTFIIQFFTSTTHRHNMTELNGKQHDHICPVWKEWKEMRVQLHQNTRQLDIISLGLQELSKHAHHLSALPEIRDKLINSATGKDQIAAKFFFSIVGILTLVICLGVVVIGFLLVGENMGMIKSLYHPSVMPK